MDVRWNGVIRHHHKKRAFRLLYPEISCACVIKLLFCNMKNGKPRISVLQPFCARKCIPKRFLRIHYNDLFHCVRLSVKHFQQTQKFFCWPVNRNDHIYPDVVHTLLLYSPSDLFCLKKGQPRLALSALYLLPIYPLVSALIFSL